MVSLILKCIKILSTLFVILILSQIIGQIPIGKHRICDITGNMVRSHWIQNTIRWVSKKFDFVEGHGMDKQHLISKIKKEEAGYASEIENTAGSSESAKSTESNDSDQTTFSGLLKR